MPEKPPASIRDTSTRSCAVEDQQGRVVAAVAYIPEQQIRPADLPHVHVRADAYLAFAKLLDFGLFGLGGSGAVGGWWLHGGVRRGFR